MGSAKLRRIVEKPPLAAKSNSHFLAPTKKAPTYRGLHSAAQRLFRHFVSARDSVLQNRLLRSVDRDALGFRFFRDHPQQVDAQQTVAQIGGLDLDVISQAEGQLESPLGNALMQEGHAFVGITLAATDGQHTLLDLQLQVFFLETGGRYDDAVLIVTVFFTL